MADRSRSPARLIAMAAALLAVLCAMSSGFAVEPGERLVDPSLETRAREIGKQLRCLVCQNQSIDDSEAELAHDLRLLVRERLAAGASDRQVIDYIVSRYGDFVLMKPPFKAGTYALWLGPAAILGAGAAAIVMFYRRRASAATDGSPPLSEAETSRLARLMEDEPR